MEWSKLDDDQLLIADDVVKWLKLSASKLNKARMTNGAGPVYIKDGQSVRYRVGDIKNWINENRRNSVRVNYMTSLIDEYDIEESEAEDWLSLN